MSERILQLEEFIVSRLLAELRLEKEYKNYIETLVEIAPEQTKEFVRDFLNYSKDWIITLYKQALRGAGTTVKIKEPRDYGLKSRANAVRQMRLLKEAWKDVIIVKVRENRHGGYPEVYLKFKLQKPWILKDLLLEAAGQLKGI